MSRLHSPQWPVVIAAVLGACSGGSAAPVEVHATTLDPPPGAIATSRRPDVRAVLDVGLDPASCSPTSCRLEHDGEAAEVDVRYDAAARVLTLTPVRALEPLVPWRARITRGVRTESGAPLARELDWTFTTGDELVWERGERLADGELLACERSRAGGALALWSRADGALQLARFDGERWSTPVLVGLTAVRAAALADDATGGIVVAVAHTDGRLRIVRRAAGEAFQQPELVADDVVGDVDVDTSLHHVLVAANRATTPAPDGTLIRQWIRGVGWRTPYLTHTAQPRVHVDGDGRGTVVCGYNRIEPFTTHTPWCERVCVDPVGVVTHCDPRPANANSVALGTKVAFGDDGRVLTAQTVETTSATEVYPVTTLFERRDNWPWQRLAPLLGADARAFDVALGPFGTALAAHLKPGSRPLLNARDETHFGFFFLGDEVAPLDPAIATAITGQMNGCLLWTAATGLAPDAPVRLRGAVRRVAGATSATVTVDGPFDAGQLPLQGLRAVAFGEWSALAMWSREGGVHFTTLR